MQSMSDPPRTAAIAAVAACRDAGIEVRMITGDQPGTAAAIGRAVGLGPRGTGPTTLRGRDLDAMDDEALAQAAVSEFDVFARVSPAHKLRLVRALQRRGEVVAVTGDGVNDAPALRQADIGVAMGVTGTDAAKEAADVVLLDDDFATVAAAVEEGRRAFENITKFITWTLPTNLAEGLVDLVAVLLGITLPITPLQILWINMTTAVALGLTLAFAARGTRRHGPPAPQSGQTDPDAGPDRTDPARRGAAARRQLRSVRVGAGPRTGGRRGTDARRERLRRGRDRLSVQLPIARGIDLAEKRRRQPAHLGGGRRHDRTPDRVHVRTADAGGLPHDRSRTDRLGCGRMCRRGHGRGRGDREVDRGGRTRAGAAR